MPEPLVIADRVSRRFGTGPAAMVALREETCAVYPGDRIALVGPSGSGKSTLLHLLGGLDEPTSGTVTWPALGPKQPLRPALVTDIFQGPSLLPPLSVIENVRLPLLLSGLTEAEATTRADVALGNYGIAHLRDKLPEEISGGQAQRAATARAVAVQPKLVLADEPTGQLDSVTAEAVLTILLDFLTEIGAAIVLSTHDLNVAARCPIVWTMRDGHLASISHDLVSAHT